MYYASVANTLALEVVFLYSLDLGKMAIERMCRVGLDIKHPSLNASLEYQYLGIYSHLMQQKP
jgi:hypothetical protein